MEPPTFPGRFSLPIPGIFLSRDEETAKLFIIDGSQRLRTIRFFKEGYFNAKEPFVLGEKVHPDFRGRSYRTLPAPDRRRFDDTVIHATVVKQERPEDDHTSIYYLFERINTGGTPAQPQEVRKAIYGGTLNSLISNLDELSAWRTVYGPPSNRIKDQELILRFLALNFDSARYGVKEGTMKDFLTSFMARNRNAASSRLARFETAFTDSIALIAEGVGRRAFRTTGALNAAIFDSVMVALAGRLAEGVKPKPEQVARVYGRLTADTAFLEATSTGTSQPANVQSRLKIAHAAFAKLK